MPVTPLLESIGGIIPGLNARGICRRFVPVLRMLMPIHLAYLSLALYAASFVCYARILYAPNLWLGRLATLLLAAAIVVHYFALLDRTQGTHTIPYDDLYGSMSLFAWLLGITYLGLELLHRQRSVGACVTLFMVIWLAALETLVPKPPMVVPPARGALFAFHVTLNTWAYSAFALSFVLSLVYLVQDPACCGRGIRARHSGAFRRWMCSTGWRAAAYISGSRRWRSASSPA